MPYDTLADLPESIRTTYSEGAQEIYREAFNNAWDEYERDPDRSHATAIGAVEQVFFHDEKSGRWRKK